LRKEVRMFQRKHVSLRFALQQLQVPITCLIYNWDKEVDEASEITRHMRWSATIKMQSKYTLV